ncbi:hypothetical protein [Amycolatopsis sp. NPDC051903]|uniref:hypothetical protein n=1 Tax=Amycolatopsis sp. NPDC051903 TaxID=3363936 RepID=UPI0037B259F4
MRNRVRVGTPERFAPDQASAKVVYRNFYTDGIVGRLEVCFAFRGWDGHRTGLMSRYATQAPTWLRGLHGHAVPLVDFGPRFAAHLLDATTLGDPVSTGSVLGDELLAWWELREWVVRAGEPAMIAETPGVVTESASLSQTWRITKGTRLASWNLKRGGADPEEMRRLKTHVSRLHAGFLAAETVLGLCVNGKLDPDHPPVERFLVSTLDTLLRPRRHGFGNAQLLGTVIGHARDVYWDTVGTLQDALGLLDNDRIRSRVAEYHDLVAGAIAPTRRGITIDVKELVMTKYESKISGGAFHGPVNTGSGGAHQHNTGTDAMSLAEALERLQTAVASMSATLPPEDAVAAEDASAGLVREADLAEDDRRRPGILARLSSLTEVATRAGGAGTALAAAVTAVRAAFGV